MNEDYPLFVKWMSVLDWILERSERMPKSVRFSVASRMASYALDVTEGIVEAIYSRDRVPILHRTNLVVEKLRVLMRICHGRRYISGRQYAFISEELDEVGRMLGGWRRASR
jgi:hypothetical protein